MRFDDLKTMISATNLKKGTTFEMDGAPFRVVKYTHQKIGRGGANVKLVVRNLQSGKQEEKTINSNAKINEISTTKKPLQYLYNDGSNASFMDPKSFEQIEIPMKVIKNQLPFIKEGETADVLFWDERPLSVEIAPKVTLKVKETTPGTKGNSATNVFKPARLENGLEIKVPLFIKVGDKVRIDTRTGDYVERIQ